MKLFFKTILAIVILLGLAAFWYWADDRDYFQSNYNNLTPQQQEIFSWRSDDNFDLMQVYRQHFTNPEFIFPRQHVSKVRLFKNIPLIGIFTGKTLQQQEIEPFLQFCNDSANFDWGETTWGLNEAAYVVRLYDQNNTVVGKIYFCLDGCHMTSASPFCPSMKFGELSATGLNKINNLIADKTKWE